MNLKALRAFQLIVEGGSLTAASKTLCLSQPAVSRLISLLEDELEILLFNRSGRALQVTEQGAAFYVATRQILTGLEEIPRIARDIQTGDRQLRLVTTPRIAQGLISPAIERLRRKRPKLRVTIDILSRFDIDNMAGLRRFDLAIASLPVSHSLVELKNEPLFRVRLEAVMRKDHSLAARKRITASDMTRVKLIGLWEDQIWRQQMNDYMRSNGAAAQYSIETRSSLMACQMAIDGAGVAVFDRVSARGFDLRDAVFRPLEPERWISFGYIHHSDQKLSDNARDLIESILHTLTDFRNESPANAASVELVDAKDG